MWSFRLTQSFKKYPFGYFLTLTYANESVPFCDNGLSLYPKHCTLFMKRLRKRFGFMNKIIYYCVGEYGSKFMRPHYHYIIMSELKIDILDFEKTWPLGSVFVGNVTTASINYTLKYISKVKKVPQYKGDNRVPEFSRMSKGIGIEYLSENILNWHASDLFNNFYCQTDEGFKIPVPRYFKDKIYLPHELSLLSDKFSERLPETINFTGREMRNFQEALKLDKKFIQLPAHEQDIF